MTERGTVDGRVARAQRTRDAVVDALLDLNEEGSLRPTAREIAERAGVSLRSVYVHFDDLEDLFCAAGQRHYEHIRAQAVLIPVDDALDVRIDAFVDQRARILEAGIGVYRAAVLQEPFSPTMANNMAIGRKLARSELASVFAPEIVQLSEPDRRLLLDALEITTNAATWTALRTYRRLSDDEARDTVRFTVRSLLRVLDTTSEDHG
jgi:TetR/AcrR family transcriptional regulator, regulator of autoinduction and epiphytic fitness